MASSQWQVYVHRELTTADLKAAFAGCEVSETADAVTIQVPYYHEEGSWPRAAVDGVNRVLFADCSDEIEAKFVDQLRQANNYAQPFSHYYSLWTDSFLGAEEILAGAIKLAQAGEGVVADADNYLQVWPELNPRIEQFDPAELEQPALMARWYVRANFDRPPLRAWIDATTAVMPPATPTKFGYPASKLAGAGLIEAEQSWRAGDPHRTNLTLEGGRKFGLVTITTYQAAQHNPQRMCAISFEVLAADYLAEPGTNQIRQLFTQTATNLGAEYGYLQVVPGCSEYRGGVASPPISELWPVWHPKKGLLGLTAGPTWLTWLGPSYQHLLANQLANPPASWQQDHYGNGVLVSLSPTPLPTAQLPRQWFSPRFRTRKNFSLSARQYVRPARDRPDWGNNN